MNTKTFLGNAVLQNCTLANFRMERGRVWRQQNDDQTENDQRDQKREGRERETIEVEQKLYRIEVQKDLDFKREAYEMPFAGLTKQQLDPLQAWFKQYDIPWERRGKLWVAIIGSSDGTVTRDELNNVRGGKTWEEGKELQAVTDLRSILVGTQTKPSVIAKYFKKIKDMGRPSFTPPGGDRKKAEILLFPEINNDGGVVQWIIPGFYNGNGELVRAGGHELGTVGVNPITGEINLSVDENTPKPNVTQKQYNVTIERVNYVFDILNGILPRLRADDGQSEGREKLKAGKIVVSDFGTTEITRGIKYTLSEKDEKALKKKGLSDAQIRQVITEYYHDQEDPTKKGREVRKGWLRKEDVVTFTLDQSALQQYANRVKQSEGKQIEEELKRRAVKVEQNTDKEKIEVQLVTLLVRLFDRNKNRRLDDLPGTRGKTAVELYGTMGILGGVDAEPNAKNIIALLVDKYRAEVGKPNTTPIKAVEVVVKDIMRFMEVGKRKAKFYLEAQKDRKNAREIESAIRRIDGFNTGQVTSLADLIKANTEEVDGKVTIDDMRILLGYGVDAQVAVYGTLRTALAQSGEYVEAMRKNENGVQEMVDAIARKFDLDKKNPEYIKMAEAVIEWETLMWIGRTTRRSIQSKTEGNTTTVTTTESSKWNRVGGGGVYYIDLGKGLRLYAGGGFSKNNITTGVGGDVGMEYTVVKGDDTAIRFHGGLTTGGVRMETMQGKYALGVMATAAYGGAFCDVGGSIRWDNVTRDFEKLVQKNFDKTGIEDVRKLLYSIKQDGGGYPKIDEAQVLGMSEAEVKTYIAGVHKAQYAFIANKLNTVQSSEGDKGSQIIVPLWKEAKEVAAKTKAGELDKNQIAVQTFFVGLQDYIHVVEEATAESREMGKNKFAGLRGAITWIGGFPVPNAGVIIRTGLEARGRVYAPQSGAEYDAMLFAADARAQEALREDKDQQTIAVNGLRGTPRADGAFEGVVTMQPVKIAGDASSDKLTIPRAVENKEGTQTTIEYTGAIWGNAVQQDSFQNLPDKTKAELLNPFNPININRHNAHWKETSGIILSGDQDAGVYKFSFDGVRRFLSNEPRMFTRYQVYVEQDTGSVANVDAKYDSNKKELIVGGNMHYMRAVTIYSGSTATVRFYLSKTVNWTPAQEVGFALAINVTEGSPDLKSQDQKPSKQYEVENRTNDNQAIDKLVVPEGIVGGKDIIDAITTRLRGVQKPETTVEVQQWDAGAKEAIDANTEIIAKKIRDNKDGGRTKYEPIFEKVVLRKGSNETVTTADFNAALEALFGSDKKTDVERKKENQQYLAQDDVVSTNGNLAKLSLIDDKGKRVKAALSLNLTDEGVVTYLKAKMTELYFIDKYSTRTKVKQPGGTTEQEHLSSQDQTKLNALFSRMEPVAKAQIRAKFPDAPADAIQALYDAVYKQNGAYSLAAFTQMRGADKGAKTTYGETGDAQGVFYALYAHTKIDRQLHGHQMPEEQGMARVILPGGEKGALGMFNQQVWMKSTGMNDGLHQAIIATMEKETKYVTEMVKTYKKLIEAMGVSEDQLTHFPTGSHVTAIIQGGKITFDGSIDVKGTKYKTIITMSADDARKSVIAGALGDCTNFCVSATTGVKVEAALEGKYVIPADKHSARSADAPYFRAGQFIVAGKYVSISGGVIKCPPERTHITIRDRSGVVVTKK